MDLKKISILLKRDEGTKLDYKQKIDILIESGKKELAKDVSAIANSRGGRGYIIIGVEDKTKRIIGIDANEFKEEQIQQIISSRCEPPIPVSIDFIVYQSKNLAIITIYDGGQKPYQLRENGAFYIRRGSTTDTMRKEELISCLQENFNLNIETIPIMNSDINSLNFNIINKYFENKGISVNNDNRLEFMDNTGITFIERDYNKRVVTLGGLLVFSSINSIYLPHNMIKIINRVNDKFDEVILVQGNLLDMLDRVEEILKKIFPSNYPISTVHEAVKNAILYRDYTIFYKEIELVVNYNSVSVISPGNLLFSTEVNTHNYLKRNMWIYDKLIALDDKKRFIKSGKGFARMKKDFIKYGKVIFADSKDDNTFKSIFPGVKHFI
ncbi:putative DNA binding domain-containing protein [Clostridium estertheticum]|uniref:AlbA family DNA-binding domain-containing protein n=1 Tax=Clostridium estertheticum TaxID=238834 RepID=UPI001CF20CC0|nr:RNA-binding domain-containing protein [Clostridium estertheticum]MCB2305190.1 putative DNA binding domain-containing protein [Clostridium estertheticum]MCB2343540.1 putative DNA binding domain-containing protein [Clostridium estertheticum]MCB2348460.1 putative DNA binding domain-containing protein [Clostridium estertheticum]WAG47408.1 putative DNA binding domain-containing protein [Clostridium estertheticum]